MWTRGVAIGVMLVIVALLALTRSGIIGRRAPSHGDAAPEWSAGPRVALLRLPLVSMMDAAGSDHSDPADGDVPPPVA